MAASTTTLVLDANRSWVRSLFGALAPPHQVHLVAVENPVERYRRLRHRNTDEDDPAPDHSVLVPGLRWFPPLSQRIVGRAVNRIGQREDVDVLVCTDPWHAASFEAAAPSMLKAYYATDPFEYYAWPTERTRELESRVLAASDIVFASSLQLVDDFRARTSAPVVHLPNAVSRRFVEAIENAPERPATLAGARGPVIGTIGQINDSYDWDLIEGLSRRLEDATIVMVGNVMQNETSRERFAELVGRPNVYWVGPKPHHELPAYLAAFDVCLNPLRRDERNDRRCPLRLFDYSATSAPIVTTPIREAEYLGDQAIVIADATEGAEAIREALSASPVDIERRRAWTARNTWDVRAQQWVARIEARLVELGRRVEPLAGG